MSTTQKKKQKKTLSIPRRRTMIAYPPALSLSHTHTLHDKYNERLIIPFNPVHYIGKLKWGGHDFTQSADNIHLEWEGEIQPQNPILHANVQVDPQGVESSESSVNLADCIKNEDGQLRFMDCF